MFQLLSDMPPEIEWEGEGILWLYPSFARQPGRCSFPQYTAGQTRTENGYENRLTQLTLRRVAAMALSLRQTFGHRRPGPCLLCSLTLPSLWLAGQCGLEKVWVTNRLLHAEVASFQGAPCSTSSANGSFV